MISTNPVHRDKAKKEEELVYQRQTADNGVDDDEDFEDFEEDEEEEFEEEEEQQSGEEGDSYGDSQEGGREDGDREEQMMQLLMQENILRQQKMSQLDKKGYAFNDDSDEGDEGLSA